MNAVKRELLPTPAIVVPLGKSMRECNKGTSQNIKAHEKVVADFDKTLELFEIGTPERAYLNSFRSQALMVCTGIDGKAADRDRALRDVEHTCSEMESCLEQNGRQWEFIKTGLGFVIAGLFSWAIFAFVASMPMFSNALSKTNHGYGFGSLIMTLAGLIIWSPIKATIAKNRALRLSNYRRKAKARIWHTYTLGVRREYYHGINPMNIAWFNMTGENPPDKQISDMMQQGLLDEPYENDLQEEPNLSLWQDLLKLIRWPWFGKKIQTVTGAAK